MGYDGYLAVLGAILAGGLLVSLFLLLRKGRKAALWSAAVTIIVGVAWYVSIIVDSFASVFIFPHDTIYAIGYSEEGFDRIEKGELKEEIIGALGMPWRRSPSIDDRSEFWYYSTQGPQYDNYWIKIVVFDASGGRVMRKVDKFYSD